ncbi:hypothetical protein BN946_scf184788.g7 [Trametes cinnabarina]|uniref:Aldos-2-ulose dehydratase beta-propeller domain-containing protein n=1 Tax=Pycnoporus cinnabarinus TaxID=5643 RepID=A0A060S1L7_PYCCI|nr:hypothetical protein BN946_scf184788.g7 [Trametes cinnabarina]
MCGGHGAPSASGNDHLAAPGSCKPITARSNETIVAENVHTGYWLQAIYFHKDDRYPDLVGFGLGTEDKPAAITLYVNPKNSPVPGTTKWEAVVIHTTLFPVATTFVDLTGDGYRDIVICDHYGPSIGQLWDAKEKDGGRVQWLRNPGNRFAKREWAAHRIGNSTGMHRLEAGHFSITSHFQILALPVAAHAADLTSPAPVIVYTPVYGANPSEGPKSWKTEVPFPNEFRLIHEVKVIPAAAGKGEFDTALVAGREGIVYLHYDKSTAKWKHTVLATGLPPTEGYPFWGAGSVDVGVVHGDPVGYIATGEAFHGNTVCVYTKRDGAPKGAAALLDAKYWTRHQIDDFGTLSQENAGTVHYLRTGDFDKVGVDAFAIACRGEPLDKPENEGVYIYRPTDLSNAKFHKSKVSDRSASVVVVAPFTNDALDIASISYYVPGSLTGPDCPSIRINPNATFHKA